MCLVNRKRFSHSRDDSFISSFGSRWICLTCTIRMMNFLISITSCGREEKLSERERENGRKEAHKNLNFMPFPSHSHSIEHTQKKVKSLLISRSFHIHWRCGELKTFRKNGKEENREEKQQKRGKNLLLYEIEIWKRKLIIRKLPKALHFFPYFVLCRNRTFLLQNERNSCAEKENFNEKSFSFSSSSRSALSAFCRKLYGAQFNHETRLEWEIKYTKAKNGN